MNYKKNSEPAGEQMTLFSLAGFLDHANHTHLQESGLGKTIQDISGQKCLEQFEKFDHVGLWAKTFSALLIGQADWFSRRCKLTWKLRGTKSRRMYFQLVPSTLRTEGTEFGLLLKTPTKMDGEVTSGKANPVSGNSGTLAQEIMSGYKPTMEKLSLLPTPTASDGTMGSIIGENDSFITTKNGTPRKVNQNGQNGSIGLGRYAAMGMLPTPTAQDGKNSTLPSSQLNRSSIVGMLCTPTAQSSRGNTSDKRGKGNLTDQIAEMDLTTSKTSQLNPQFVLEMMGFPSDWTELPFLNGETSPSKQQETQ